MKWFALTLVFCLAVMLWAPVGLAAPRVWTLEPVSFDGVTYTALTDSIVHGVSDTTSVIQMDRCSDLMLKVIADCDTASVALIGSEDGTNYYSLLTATTVVGTAGTKKVVWFAPLVRNGGAAGSVATYTDFKMPPPRYVKAIIRSSDSARAIRHLVAKILCTP